MEHRVFISHSSKDKMIADAICHNLEEAEIPCWIAPRDIQSSDWAGSIMQGITSCDVFVVIISHNSIPSPEVTKEVTEATRVCQYILPFKVDEEMLNDRLRYHLAPCHWLDAVNPPLQARIDELKQRICNLTDQDALYANTTRQRVVGHTVAPKIGFLGRQEEMDTIHQMLQQEPVLFLQGMGGIGKSEIAKGYAQRYADSYKKVLFLNYRGSVLDMVIGEDVHIENLQRNTAYGTDGESSEAFFQRKLQALKADTDNQTLLIVDNFDVEYDENLDALLSGPYKVILTSRYEHLDYPCLPVGPIADPNTVYQLFTRNYGRPIPPKDKPIVEQILELVGCHTITVELIAKQMRVSFMSPAKMLQALQQGGTNAGLKEGVRRGASSKNAFGYITDLFCLSGLTEQERYIMQCMCMVPFSGIDVYVLQECLELEDMEDIYQLTAKSWLMLDEETYKVKMHPVICDVAKEQLQPDQEKCSQYILGIWKYMGNAWFQPSQERNEKWPYIDHILQHYPMPTEDLWQQYLDFANTAWICGQYAQSIEASKALYAFTLQQYGDAGYKPAFAARTVAGSYFNAGDPKGAEPYYYLGLEHMLKKPEESYKELGYAYQKVARCAYTSADYAKGEEYLMLSLEAFEKARQDPKENMSVITHVDSYVDLCRMHMAQGNYTQAISYSQTAYDTLYSWKNCEVTSSSYCLCDMGICYSQLGDYQKAEEYLNRALALNIHFNGENSMVTVRTREHIADNLAKQGRTEEAVSAYVALLLEMEKNFGSECPQVKRLQEKEKQLLQRN